MRNAPLFLFLLLALSAGHAVRSDPRIPQQQSGQFFNGFSDRVVPRKITANSIVQLEVNSSQLEDLKAQLNVNHVQEYGRSRLSFIESGTPFASLLRARKPVRARPPRFDVAWDIVPRFRMPSLAESGHRVLYSAISNVGSDGLGHAMAVLNSEVRTAMLLNISYTHRVAQYASLTRGNPQGIENFFAWGRGEIPRDLIEDSVCSISHERRAIGSSRLCQVCNALKPFVDRKRLLGSTRFARIRHMNVNRVVDVPFQVSNGNCPIGAQVNRKGCEHVEAFRKIVRRSPNTIFQMGKERCSLVPAHSEFRGTRPYFYWKYWGSHGRSRAEGEWQPENPSSRPSVNFNRHELIVATHIRRGDFLVVRHRKLISCKTFMKVIRSIQEAVLVHGGNFGKLPMAVYIYSEGRIKNVPSGIQHDVAHMTHEFVDWDGVTRDERWIQNVLTKTNPQNDSIGPWNDGTLPLPRIEMRIAQDTVTSLHEMIAADIFIGSMSGMSSHVVGTLSRGVQVQPNLGCSKTSSISCFNPTSGDLARSQFLKQWEGYTRVFQDYI